MRSHQSLYVVLLSALAYFCTTDIRIHILLQRFGEVRVLVVVAGRRCWRKWGGGGGAAGLGH